MINQQLLDFIKQKLQQGLTKENISKELLANGWTTQDIKDGFNVINNKLKTGKRNFWVFLPLILFILMIISFIPSVSNAKNLSFIGFFLLVGFGYSIFFGLFGVLSSIVLFIWPKRILKIVLNILSALILIPIIYINLTALWFVYVGGPAMDKQQKEEVRIELAKVNGKSFIPLAVNNNFDVLLPGNIILRDSKLLNLNKDDVVGFNEIFKKEVIDKKKEVQVSLSDNPYTTVFTAGANDSWLEQSKNYRLVEGNLSIDGEIIDRNFILDEGGKYELKNIDAYFSLKSKEISKQSQITDGFIEYYILPTKSLTGDEVKIYMLPSANCFDSNNKIVGCSQDIQSIIDIYGGKSTIRYFEKDGRLYVTKVIFQNK